MKLILFIFANIFLALISPIARAYEVGGHFANSTIHYCSQAKSYLQALNSGERLTDKQLKLLRHEAAVVTLSFETPVTLTHRSLTMSDGSGGQIIIAEISQPAVGATRSPSSIHFPEKGMSSLSVTFSIAGFCPYYDGNRANVGAGLYRAVHSLVQ